MERTVSDAVVKLCLKLTESELKAMLARLAEWRDSTNLEDASSAKISLANLSRGVAYFRLLATLGDKLKALFCSSLSPYWQHIIDCLKALAAHEGEGDNRSSKKGKKRKLGEDTKKDDAYGRELLALCQQSLETVRVCCTHDAEEFVNEERYGDMLPAVAGLLLLFSSFRKRRKGMEEVGMKIQGMGICTDVTLAVSLALCVSKDTLWKPLAHHVLMATRHSRWSVRLASLHTLHQLFIEVGEEFLVLLPECLPFLSELLEDESSDVADLTSKVVRYIEELSGEKLDQYLQ